MDSGSTDQWGQDQCDKNVIRTIEEYTDESLYLSVKSIGEITKGIELLNESHRKSELQSWLQT